MSIQKARADELEDGVIISGQSGNTVLWYSTLDEWILANHAAPFPPWLLTHTVLEGAQLKSMGAPVAASTRRQRIVSGTVLPYANVCCTIQHNMTGRSQGGIVSA